MSTFRAAVVLACPATAVSASTGSSVYRNASDDPRAIAIPAAADGLADDSAVQQSLDAASNRGAGHALYSAQP